MASFFFPSTYICTGLPSIKNPVKAAEKTKSKSMAIGANIAFAFPNFASVPRYMKNPTATIYKVVKTELIKASFLILFTTLLYQIIANHFKILDFWV